MREALIILLVIAALLALTAFRYRRQIAAAVKIWRTLKAMRTPPGGQPEIKSSQASKGPLVRCAKCGTWVPEGGAIQLGKQMYYCSANCLETGVKA